MKILFLNHSDPILQFLAEAAERQNHQARVLPLNAASTFEMISKAIEEFQPDFCLTNNFYLVDVPYARQLENYFETRNIPLVAWYFDPPHAAGTFNMSRRWLKKAMPTKSVLYLTADSGFVEFIEKAGATAFHLPLAINSKIQFEASPPGLTAKFNAPSTYIGKPFEFPSSPSSEAEIRNLFVQGLNAEFWSQVFMKRPGGLLPSAEVSKKYNESFSSLFEFFSPYYADSNDYRSAQNAFIDEWKKNIPLEYWDCVQEYRGRLDFLYSWYHHNLTLGRLAKSGLRVYGGEGWKKLLTSYSGDTPRLSDQELHAAYRGSKSIFCTTKFQFINLAHDRPMAVLACGGLPITDFRADISAMFDADEIVTYRDLDEAKDLIQHYATHESDRRSLIEKGRARVFSDHTYDHRLSKLIEIVSKHFGLVSKPKAMAPQTLKPLRTSILEAATLSQEGHIPSAFSILDLLWVLYDQQLRKDKDCFILSKGHASLGLYAVLAEKGYFAKEELKKFASYSSFLGGHPDSTKVPGVEASTGSLGHGLPLAIGRALASKIKKTDAHIYCLIGDGEANEGSVWESALLAAHHALNNFSLIVDFNHSTDRALKLGSLKEKFESFGWEVVCIKGHDHEEIRSAYAHRSSDKPIAIIAETIKGFGCPSMENNPSWHHKSPKPAELEALVSSLRH